MTPSVIYSSFLKMSEELSFELQSGTPRHLLNGISMQIDDLVKALQPFAKDNQIAEILSSEIRHSWEDIKNSSPLWNLQKENFLRRISSMADIMTCFWKTLDCLPKENTLSFNNRSDGEDLKPFLGSEKELAEIEQLTEKIEHVACIEDIKVLCSSEVDELFLEYAINGNVDGLHLIYNAGRMEEISRETLGKSWAFAAKQFHVECLCWLQKPSRFVKIPPNYLRTTIGRTGENAVAWLRKKFDAKNI